MKLFHVLFHTETNHAIQIMVVQAENKAEAKSIVRGKFSEQVYFISVIKGN